MAGVSTYNKYQVVPIPRYSDGDNKGAVYLNGLEQLLNGMREEGWVTPQPIDLMQPGLVFIQTIVRDVDDRIEEVLRRLEEGSFETWAPEIAPLDPGIPDLIHEWMTVDQLRRTIRAVLAVSF